MKRIIMLAFASMLAVDGAQAGLAGQPFDRNLEAAAAEAFATRAGPIRGTFAAEEKPVLVTEDALAFEPQPLGAGKRPAQSDLSILLKATN